MVFLCEVPKGRLVRWPIGSKGVLSLRVDETDEETGDVWVEVLNSSFAGQRHRFSRLLKVELQTCKAG